MAAAAPLAVALAGPSVARALDPDPRGLGVLQLGVGFAKPGASVVLMGAGLGLLDDGRTRVDLLGRFGFSNSTEESLVDPVLYGRGDAESLSFSLELTWAWRRGRLEPWLGLGYGAGQSTGSFIYGCSFGGTPPDCAGGYTYEVQSDTLSGDWVAGPTCAAGIRLILTEHLLLEAEARYQKRGRSRFEELPVTGPVGGGTGLVSILWRGGVPAPGRQPSERSPESEAVLAPPREEAPPSAPPPAPSPAEEVAPPPVLPPAVPPERGAVRGCPSGKTPVFRVHGQHRFRCFPDPVRGGFHCEESIRENEFSDPRDCERACRSGGDACPAGGALGAACERCVAACARARSVPCAPEGEGTPGGDGCRLKAGAWGAPESRVVPASCPAPDPDG
jgi:hypothetical protein